jgi:nucleoside-diphosphate-sugar epimerase
MTTWGIIGASGFIGLRTAESLHGQNGIAVRPIVRAASSLAVLARRQLDWRIASPHDAAPLAKALSGCDVCIQAAIGDEHQIVNMAKQTYLACALAGVQRLVWLSSASVHGQNAETGTTEETPLQDNQLLSYNNAKVRAEWILERLARDGRVEVVRLRPSVVFGPRSRWIMDTVKNLQNGRAGWVDHGGGICNSIHIDNLVEAIRLAATVPSASGEAFLVGDTETITWRDFLLPIADHLGFSPDAFANLHPQIIQPDRDTLRSRITRTKVYQFLGDSISARIKRLAAANLTAWPEPVRRVNAWHQRRPATAAVTSEVMLLQQCDWKLSNGKATRILGYHPPVSFAEGMEISLGWVDFVTNRNSS